MIKKFKCELRSWENIYQLSRGLSEKIIGSGFKPDIIIGLARGGWVPSRNLCDFLGVKDLISLKVEHWGVTASPDGKAKLKYPLEVDLSGKRVLLVDDITDTGESLKLTKEFVGRMRPMELRTATLQYMTGSNFKPDFYAEAIDSEKDWTWIIYPWNVTEDLCNLIGNLVDHNSAIKMGEVRHGLKDTYQLEVKADLLDRIMREMERRDIVERIEKDVLKWKGGKK